ncbi:dihydrofolate reductase [Chthonobacter rhizosphaerae]|uniref:dihydrofolate reductase n=1 Tax=Chthonobacter rhizosphaerae TaxID=2735553 RepID=UPI0015EE39B6|nr:dihydrofolate reductase [Chthonobacter rhizosphaerae]
MTDPAAIPLTLVVAVARNGVIGREGDMPWRLSSDLRHFRRITMGKPVVMGRKTLEAIGRPLAGRPNLIVSRSLDPSTEGVSVFPDLDAAIAAARRIAAETAADEVIIGGGGQIYAETIGRADQLRITHVDVEVEGDTTFPTIDPALWRPVDDEPMPRTDRDDADARWVTYERVRS